MGHVPHLHLPGPWPGGHIALHPDHRHHLERVLRRSPGDPVTYTDGAGTFGEGRLADGSVERGAERSVPAPPPLTVAVAPPAAKDRIRFMVEKLAELGVPRLCWVDARLGEGRVPRIDRARAWAEAALEQSRGAWRTEVTSEPATLTDLGAELWIADPAGEPLPRLDRPTVLAIGPEGGWEPEEIPVYARRVGLGGRILRVETAALVAAARLLVHDAGRDLGHAE